MASFEDELVQRRTGQIGSGVNGVPADSPNTQRRVGKIGAGGPGRAVLGNTGAARQDRGTTSVPRGTASVTGGRTGPFPTQLGSPTFTGTPQQQAFEDAGGAQELETGANSAEAMRQYRSIIALGEDSRGSQRKADLERLAFNTPRNLDNIGQIKFAEKLLLQERKNEGAVDASRSDTGIRDELALRKDAREGRKEVLGFQKAATEKQEAAEAKVQESNQRLNDLETKQAEASGDPERVEAVAQAQTLRERQRQSFKSFDEKKSFDETFKANSPERALAEKLPGLVGLVQSQLQEDTLFDTQTPPVQSLKDALDLFQGFSGDFFQTSTFGGAAGGATAGAVLGGVGGGLAAGPFGIVPGAIGGAAGGAAILGGDDPNINIRTAGGGFEDVDTEQLNEFRGELAQLFDPRNEAGRAVVEAVYGKDGAAEFYARVGQNSPFTR